MKDPGKTLQVGASYFSEAFDDDSDTLVKTARTLLKDVDFDTMVGTGLSGSLVIPVLARAFDVNFAIVRKEPSPHDSSLVVGRIGQRWLFVDDFVSGGETRRRVKEAVKTATETHRTWNPYAQDLVNSPWNATYVGTYAYSNSYCRPHYDPDGTDKPEIANKVRELYDADVKTFPADYNSGRIERISRQVGLTYSEIFKLLKGYMRYN